MDTKQKIEKLIQSGITQSQLSVEAKISQATISRILSGVHTWVRPDTSSKIDDIYSKYESDLKAA